VYSFSSYLEVIFLENFKPEYLNAINENIKNFPLKYSELFTECFERINEHAYSSIQSKIYKGPLHVGRKILGIDPDVKKALISAYIDIKEKSHLDNIERTMVNFKQSLENQNEQIAPFVENINTINKLYNQPLELVFNNEIVYIGTTQI
jgi:hypothetical protein